MYVNNAVTLTNTGKILTIGTSGAPVSDIIIWNTVAKPLYIKPWSVGETAIAVSATTGVKLSTGATPFVIRHSQTEAGNGYVGLSLITTATGACRVWAK